MKGLDDHNVATTEKLVITSASVRCGEAQSPHELYTFALENTRHFHAYPTDRLDPGMRGTHLERLSVCCMRKAPASNDDGDDGREGKKKKKPYRYVQTMLPEKLQTMDPAHHLALQLAEELVDQDSEPLPERTVVIIANTMLSEVSRGRQTLLSGHQLLQQTVDPKLQPPLAEMMRDMVRDIPSYNPFSLAGWMSDTIAGEVANYLGCKGGCFVVSSACAGSLEAVHLACQALASGDADAAIVGGIDISLDSFETRTFDELGLMHVPPIAQPFQPYQPLGKNRRGFCPSEGGAMILIRRRKANRDELGRGDVELCHWGASSNGAGSAEAPSHVAQAAAALHAYRATATTNMNVTPPHAVIAHGTGTDQGDVEELKGIKMFLEALASSLGGDVNQPPVVVTSVKGCIGHAKAAAGILSLIMAMRSIQCGSLPGIWPRDGQTIDVDTPLMRVARGNVILGGGGDDDIKKIGVQATGFGGHNVHICLAGRQAIKTPHQLSDDMSQAPIPLSTSMPCRVRDVHHRLLLLWPSPYAFSAGSLLIEKLFTLVGQCRLADAQHVVGAWNKYIQRNRQNMDLLERRVALLAAHPAELLHNIKRLELLEQRYATDASIDSSRNQQQTQSHTSEVMVLLGGQEIKRGANHVTSSSPPPVLGAEDLFEVLSWLPHAHDMYQTLFGAHHPNAAISYSYTSDLHPLVSWSEWLAMPCLRHCVAQILMGKIVLDGILANVKHVSSGDDASPPVTTTVTFASHSLGDYAALALSNVFSTTSVLRALVARERLLLSPKWVSDSTVLYATCIISGMCRSCVESHIAAFIKTKKMATTSREDTEKELDRLLLYHAGENSATQQIVVCLAQVVDEVLASFHHAGPCSHAKSLSLPKDGRDELQLRVTIVRRRIPFHTKYLSGVAQQLQRKTMDKSKTSDFHSPRVSFGDDGLTMVSLETRNVHVRFRLSVPLKPSDQCMEDYAARHLTESCSFHGAVGGSVSLSMAMVIINIGPPYAPRLLEAENAQSHRRELSWTHEACASPLALDAFLWEHGFDLAASYTSDTNDEDDIHLPPGDFTSTMRCLASVAEDCIKDSFVTINPLAMVLRRHCISTNEDGNEGERLPKASAVAATTTTTTGETRDGFAATSSDSISERSALPSSTLLNADVLLSFVHSIGYTTVASTSSRFSTDSRLTSHSVSKMIRTICAWCKKDVTNPNAFANSTLDEVALVLRNAGLAQVLLSKITSMSSPSGVMDDNDDRLVFSEEQPDGSSTMILTPKTCRPLCAFFVNNAISEIGDSNFAIHDAITASYWALDATTITAESLLSFLHAINETLRPSAAVVSSSALHMKTKLVFVFSTALTNGGGGGGGGVCCSSFLRSFFLEVSPSAIVLEVRIPSSGSSSSFGFARDLLLATTASSINSIKCTLHLPPLNTLRRCLLSTSPLAVDFDPVQRSLTPVHFVPWVSRPVPRSHVVDCFRGSDVLILGATGYIGSRVAKLLSSSFRRVICVGRRATPPPDLARIANVVYLAANICQTMSVVAALGSKKKAQRPQPPNVDNNSDTTSILDHVRVIVHIAGLGSPAAFIDVHEDSLKSHLAPKLRGLSNVLSLFSAEHLSRLCVFGTGSIIGSVGVDGSAAYALANAEFCRALHRVSVSSGVDPTAPTPMVAFSSYLELTLISGRGGLGGDEVLAALQARGHLLSALSVDEAAEAIADVVLGCSVVRNEEEDEGLTTIEMSPPVRFRHIRIASRLGKIADQPALTISENPSSCGQWLITGSEFLYQHWLRPEVDLNLMHHRLNNVIVVPAAMQLCLIHDACRSMLHMRRPPQKQCFQLVVRRMALHSLLSLPDSSSEEMTNEEKQPMIAVLLKARSLAKRSSDREEEIFGKGKENDDDVGDYFEVAFSMMAGVTEISSGVVHACYTSFEAAGLAADVDHHKTEHDHHQRLRRHRGHEREVSSHPVYREAPSPIHGSHYDIVDSWSVIVPTGEQCCTPSETTATTPCNTKQKDDDVKKTQNDCITAEGDDIRAALLLPCRQGRLYLSPDKQTTFTVLFDTMMSSALRMTPSQTMIPKVIRSFSILRPDLIFRTSGSGSSNECLVAAVSCRGLFVHVHLNVPDKILSSRLMAVCDDPTNINSSGVVVASLECDLHLVGADDVDRSQSSPPPPSTALGVAAANEGVNDGAATQQSAAGATTLSGSDQQSTELLVDILVPARPMRRLLSWIVEQCQRKWWPEADPFHLQVSSLEVKEVSTSCSTTTTSARQDRVEMVRNDTMENVMILSTSRTYCTVPNARWFPSASAVAADCEITAARPSKYCIGCEVSLLKRMKNYVVAERCLQTSTNTMCRRFQCGVDALSLEGSTQIAPPSRISDPRAFQPVFTTVAVVLAPLLGCSLAKEKDLQLCLQEAVFKATQNPQAFHLSSSLADDVEESTRRRFVDQVNGVHVDCRFVFLSGTLSSTLERPSSLDGSDVGGDAKTLEYTAAIAVFECAVGGSMAFTVAQSSEL